MPVYYLLIESGFASISSPDSVIDVAVAYRGPMRKGYRRNKHPFFTFSRDNGQKLAMSSTPRASEIWLNLIYSEFLNLH